MKRISISKLASGSLDPAVEKILDDVIKQVEQGVNAAIDEIVKTNGAGATDTKTFWVAPNSGVAATKQLTITIKCGLVTGISLT